MSLFATYVFFFAHLKNSAVCLHNTEFWESFINSGYRVFSGYVTSKYYVSIFGLPFHDLKVTFEKTCSFWWSLNYQKFFLCIFFNAWGKKSKEECSTWKLYQIQISMSTIQFYWTQTCSFIYGLSMAPLVASARLSIRNRDSRAHIV